MTGLRPAAWQRSGDGNRDNGKQQKSSKERSMDREQAFDQQIAIIGMAGRFPRARNIDEFWQNLQNGVEAIAFFSDEELIAAGINPALLNNPKYVKAYGELEGIEFFDASFFGYSPREAETIDPQQRLFLECAWEALESAGYDPQDYEGRIGVYGGSAMSTYLGLLFSHPDYVEAVGAEQIIVGNDKDFLPTRVSYKLNLKGPSIAVQTACSTSLVATHLACQSLLNGECDMALAGGVSIRVPQKAGYLYQEGSISSPDGHCRAFDATAQGAINGSGVGIVVLKRLKDALADRDYIHAIIRGSAINNDGSMKIGYMAPSADGQAEVIAEALAIAGVEPETISYIEAHGTGTPLGDPIEIAALTQAFGARTARKGFCAVGSVKTNVGHLDTAAGVTGLMKAALALEHRLLPPSLHFTRANPQIDFANSPFYVNTVLTPWPAGSTPRRAGVSSFGIGGTNAHMILEEAPAVETEDVPEIFRSSQLLLLSAKTPSALETATENLVRYLKQHPDLRLADVAFTLQNGRRAFSHRRMAVCRDVDDAVTVLEMRDPRHLVSAVQESRNRPVVFMFPGTGAQYINMSFELYQHEPVFRQQVDHCSELLTAHLGLDLRRMLYPAEQKAELAATQLRQTSLAMPALFVTEYALAQLWMSWGVHPQAMIGHSLGEYVAGCLAGVFSLPDALALVAWRARVLAQVPAGAMLSVPLSAQQLQPLLQPDLSLAAVNGPALCVVSGPHQAITEMEEMLARIGLEGRRVPIDAALHSEMVTPALEPFKQFVSQICLHAPCLPYVSNVTGTWITAQEAVSPNYWVAHLRQTVRFADGIQTLLQEPDLLLLEVGPGHTLSTLAKQQIANTRKNIVFPSLGYTRDHKSELASFLNTTGQLWLAGVHIDWAGFAAHEQARRIPLPTYPFERQWHWVKSAPAVREASTSPAVREANTSGSSATSWELPTPPGPSTVEAPEDQAGSVPPLPSGRFMPNFHTSPAPPTNEIERIIAVFWHEILGVDQLGIHDNFFELGGHSLMAAQLISRLREALQVEIPLRSFFERPTIAELAEVAEEMFVEKLEQLPEEDARLLSGVFHHNDE